MDAYAWLPSLTPADVRAVIAVSYACAFVVAGIGLAHTIAWRRILKTAWPRHLDRLLDDPPHWPVLFTVAIVVGGINAIAATAVISYPGAWQSAMLAGYFLAVLTSRRFNSAMGLTACVLGSLTMVGFPLAAARELFPPGAADALDLRQWRFFVGFTLLIAALVWALASRRWVGWRSSHGPVATTNQLTFAAVINAVGCFLLAGVCLAAGFLTDNTAP